MEPVNAVVAIYLCLVMIVLGLIVGIGGALKKRRNVK